MKFLRRRPFERLDDNPWEFCFVFHYADDRDEIWSETCVDVCRPFRSAHTKSIDARLRAWPMARSERVRKPNGRHGERMTEQWGRERMKDELRRAFYYYFRFALGGSGCDGVPGTRGGGGERKRWRDGGKYVVVVDERHYRKRLSVLIYLRLCRKPRAHTARHEARNQSSSTSFPPNVFRAR